MTDTAIEERTLREAARLAHSVADEVARSFIGPRDVTELLLVALVARGHVLLEGVPGVAKTTLVKAFSGTLGCRFRRIQFTPDLLPADITGTYVLNQHNGTFVLREGPVFANIVLGDEINRAPAKTQSALLEAMQETQVTVEGETRKLEPPFMVLATQNPVEQEGTYPLPEAQIDRFLMKVEVGYPLARQERAILRAYSGQAPAAKRVLTPQEILWLQEIAERIHADDEILDYMVALVAFTRDHPHVQLGASPRASLQLMYACRARALLAGRHFVLPDDVKALATPVLAHRLLLSAEAELDGVLQRQIVEEALRGVAHRPESRR
jgi:MoxR-like ATPase